MKDVNNYVSYPISVFDDSNTLYMQKQVNGFTYTFLLKFISFNGSMIEGEILQIQPNNIKSLRIKNDIYNIGSNIKGAIKTCYLFSGSCRWFFKSNSDWYAL